MPFDDLNVILESDVQRVFLTRDEYEELLDAAKEKPAEGPQHAPALLSAEYTAKLEEGRAAIAGKLTLETFGDDLVAVPLNLAGVGVLSAKLDGKPAALARNGNQGVTLFVQSRGKHTLDLALTAPLQTSAAQQTLQLTLPTTAAAKLSLTVPGNVEVKGGAAVATREYDEATEQTTFELLPPRGPLALVLSLNNKQLRDQAVVVARSVLVDEVTQGYERIHATVSYRVLHGAIEKLRIAAPVGFEVTKVEATALARWEVDRTDAKQPIIEATLREPTSETIVLEIAANRSPQMDEPWLDTLKAWHMPQLTPLDVAGQVAVVGLLVEDRLQPQQIVATNLIPIDATTLASAIPASVFQADPGAPTVRQVVSYYAPDADFSLAASFLRPPAGVRVTANSLLLLGDEGLRYVGGLSLFPEAEEIFEVWLAVPPGWQVTEVTTADGTPLAIEKYDAGNAGTRLQIRLPGGIAAGQATSIRFRAVSNPAGWLDDWQLQTITFPQFTVEGATSDRGAIAVQVQDDLSTRPDKLENLVPLLDAEKTTYGFGDLPTSLAYQYESRPFAATIVVERIAPSITADVYSFLKLEPDNLVAHYELMYHVRDARTRRLVFSLPAATTPAELTVRGLGGVSVKEFRGVVADDRRVWTVELAARQAGDLALVVDFQNTLTPREPKGFVLPLVQAEEVEYQSAFVAVEGSAELDVQATSTARKVDVGELAGAEYQLGRRVIGAFGYVGNTGEVKVDVLRRDSYPLPAALVQRAELLTQVSQSGLKQSVARYDLLTKATLLEIRLPAESTLWTIYLDGAPTKPVRDKDSLLVSLPATQFATVRKLQIVYETRGTKLALSGMVDALAPRLLLQNEGEQELREVPAADLQWQLILPTGYRVRRSEGTVFTDEIPRREMAAVTVGRFLYDALGGIGRHSAVHALRAGGANVTWDSAKSEAKSVIELENQLEYGGFEGKSNMPMPMEEMLRDESGSMAPHGGENKPADAFGVMPPMAEPPPRPMALPPVVSATPEPSAPASPPASKEAAPPAPAADMPQQPNAPPVSGPVAGRPARTPAEMDAKKEADRAEKLWALEGVSSLPIEIEIDHSVPATTFQSLGADAELKAAVVDTRRVHAAAWGMALLVALVGIGLTLKSTGKQVAYVIVVLLGASLPLLLTRRLDDVAIVFDYVFFAGCLLVPYFLLAAITLAIYRPLARWCANCCQMQVAPGPQTIGLLLVAVSLLFGSTNALGQEAQPRVVDFNDLKLLLDPGGPVNVPADAVIVPYDASKEDGVAKAEKLLVPYAKYIELWNRVHPDKKIEPTNLPADYALAGATYQATLRDADDLLLTGKLEIDVFTDKPVSIPLDLAGGVLLKATVDGKAARLQTVAPAPPAENAKQPAQQAAAPAKPAAGPLLTLFLSGKGRKQVELTIRLGLTRQGGWRIASGRLPSAPATALTLTVPTEKTEVRLSGVQDRGSLETKQADEKIEVALAGSGALELQWRPKVSEGQVDQSLTASSTAVLDVREDALRLVWQVRLDFGRGTREQFTLRVPTDYLVEQVTGSNIRGWELKPGMEGAKTATVEVTLLKPAQGNETLAIYLARRGRTGQGDLAKIEVPTVAVEGAALQQGNLAVRRSPRLELRTLSSTGLSRADADGQTQVVEQLSDASDAAVLMVRPYQSFRFLTVPFALTLAANPAPRDTTAEVRSVLRIAQRETTLDASVALRIQGQPLYRVRLYLPENFTLERVAPKEIEWAVTQENGRSLLSVHLLDGKTGQFTLTLFGTFGKPAEAGAVPLPKLEVLDVERQDGEIAVLPDPDLDVRTENLQNIELAPSVQTLGWLQGGQRSLARIALRYRTPDYSGTLRLVARQPRVTARSITNVKVTPRSIEETLFLNFQIADAGISELSFLVPDYLAKARVKSHLLKRRIVEDPTDAAGQPIAGMKRIRLELQDFVIGPYAVIVEHDRLLTSDKHTAAVPVIETGTTLQRFVAIENAGRDEVVIEPGAGFERLNPQQQAWRDLTRYVGDNITQAFLATADAGDPKVTFQTRDRERVETVGARIELATTLLIVDEAGAYRGRQEYRLKNETEQFLDVQLPAGARLWTAIVAGEPVKPVEMEPKQAGVVRIPIIKTTTGDPDYPVELKYGGRMESVQSLSNVNFPLLKTLNIQPLESQVRLMLPDAFRWFAFDGTMHRVTDAGELKEGVQAYLNRRIEEATRLLQSSNPYTKLRAQNNLKGAKLLFDMQRQAQNGEQSYSDFDKSYENANEALLQQVEQQIDQVQAAQQDGQGMADNRRRFNDFLENQQVERSKNVVSKLGSNFNADIANSVTPQDGTKTFNEKWLDQNKLANTTTESISGKQPMNAPAKPGAQQSAGQQPGEPQSRVTRGGRVAGAKDAQNAPIQVELGDFERDMAPKNDLLGTVGDYKGSGISGRGEQEKLQRYQQNLELNNSEPRAYYGVPQQQAGGTPGGGGFGGGMAGNPQGQSRMDEMSSSRSRQLATNGAQPVDDPFGRPGGVDSREFPAAGIAFAREGEEAQRLEYTLGIGIPDGLASLDVALPTRGVTYDFITPRGELEIVARPVANTVVQRLYGLAGVLIAIVLLVIFSHPAVRSVFAALGQSIVAPIALVVLGLASMILGILPLGGLVLVLAGVVLAVLLLIKRLTVATA